MTAVRHLGFLPHASKVLFLARWLFCLCLEYLRKCWRDLHQIDREDMFGPSLRRVWMSTVKVKVTRGKKRAVCSHHPWQWRNGTCLLQIMSRGSGRHHSVGPGRGWFWRATCSVCMVKHL